MVPHPDWAALDRALDHALDLEGSEREAFLASLDGSTREALEPLLRDALRDDPLLDHPETALAPLREHTDHVLNDQHITVGTHIGPYEIEALIGEGGMGRVFRAHRADGAFKQTVAIKIVRTTLMLVGSNVSARLRRERDLLAALNHPGIARLLDGGETSDGVPYLVTEFIDGVPITTWADEHRLDVKARARLMIQVAQAVSHANRRFIVHRDLKPSNVIVTERDGEARPVVLDFGIAKLLDNAETEGMNSPLTRTGLRLLTPAYAAPELFEPTAPVTTAVDVYGLGALLYKLLTGHRPHGDTDSPPTTEATRPSKMVLLSETVNPSQRARALRGDLDTICLKALHPDPSRRYASADAFAEDLARYLDGRPIEAQPDSLAYLAGRFIRYHRTTVIAAVCVLVALVGGLAVALVALSNEQEARTRAEEEMRRATEATELLTGLFQMANPDYDAGREVTVREAVEEGARRARSIESDPLRAHVLFVLGRVYMFLGEPAIADTLLQAALDIHGEDAVSDEATQIRYSLSLTGDALADPERVLALGQKIYRDHRDDADPGTALTALRIISMAYSRLSRHDEAVETAQHARDWVEEFEGSPEQRMQVNERLGEALFEAGHVPESIPYLEMMLRMSYDIFGEEDAHTSRALSILGRARGHLGEIEEAEALLRKSIAFHAQRYGAHRVGYQLSYLGEARLRAGQYQAAAAVLDSAATMAGPIIGLDHPDIGDWLVLRAQACNAYGAYRDAEQAARRALAIAEAHRPVPTVLQARALARLGLALQGQGLHQDARSVLRQALLAFESPQAQPLLGNDEVATVRSALAAVGGTR